jgi:outer membrane protein TolC
VREQRGVFEPVLKAEATWQRTDAMRPRSTTPGFESVETDQIQSKAAVETLLPTGTRVTAEASAATLDSSAYLSDLASARTGLTVSQALLSGRGTGVNLASLRQARLDAAMSEYELRGLIESLVARVERTCWDYALAGRQLVIREDSVRLAEQLRAETAERIRLGQLAETEMASAEAEIALRREEVINATSSLAATRLRLLRLLSPPGAGLWDRPMFVRTPTNMAEVATDPVEDHVRVALRFRPDLNQARLLGERNEIEVVRTRDGLLPRLDFFLTLGGTGYAESLVDAPFRDEGDGSDVLVGLRGEVPFGNRQAQARHERARLNRWQSLRAIQNLSQAVEVEVRTAILEVERARAQVAATEATRKRQEEKRRAEVEKYRVGRSTSLLVAQAERDMLQSRLAEAQSVAGCFKAIVELYRLDGSLLERRGLIVPGREPPLLDETPARHADED